MFTIRKLKDTDAEVFLSIRLAGLKECPSAFGSSFEEEHEQSVQQVASRLPTETDNENWFLGAFNDKAELVGIIAFQRWSKLKQKHGGALYATYVMPMWRKRGVGQALVTEAINMARSLPGMLQLQLWVGVENHSAHSLYEKMGFRACGILPRSLHVDGKFYDESLMVLELVTVF